MKTLCGVIVSLALLAGCARKPTLDNLTYFEAAQLVDVETRRLEYVSKIYREAPSNDEARLLDAMEKQARRVELAIELRDRLEKAERGDQAGGS